MPQDAQGMPYCCKNALNMLQKCRNFTMHILLIIITIIITIIIIIIFTIFIIIFIIIIIIIIIITDFIYNLALFNAFVINFPFPLTLFW